MSNSTTMLDLIAASQSQKEVTANAMFDAASPAMLWGRRATTTAGLTWGYYGGYITVAGTPVAVANGTLELTASATNYVEANATTGAVSANTSAFTSGKIPLYEVVTGASSVTSYTDVRGGSAAVSGGAAVADGDKGDIVVSAGGTAWAIDSAVLSAFGRTLTDDADAATARATLGLGSAATLAADTDTTLAADSDSRVATQKAVKAYVDGIVTGGASNVMIFKGVIDASASPNYPAADAGHLYKISVAGKIGGASGPSVEAGDTLYCITDATAAGNHATVGGAWVISQVNIDGAVIGPTSATADALALYDGTTGKLVKDSGKTLSTDGTLAADSDAMVPTQKAVKTYVDAAVGGGGGGVAGSDKQIQFNDGGVLGADAGLTFDKTTYTVEIGTVHDAVPTKAYVRGKSAASAGAGFDGSDILIAGGDGASSGGNSGSTTITTGIPGSAGAAGTITVKPNQLPSAPAGRGGNVTVSGGDDTSGSPGTLTLSGGSSTSTGTGATASLSGGSGSNGGGKVTVKGGDHTGSNNGITGAEVEIKGGTANRQTIAGTATGGPVNITGGAATGSTNAGAGGAVTVSGGTAAGTGAGGSVTVKGGVPTNGAGGSAAITATAGVGTNQNGGNVNITPGAATGTGAPGNVVLNNSGAALATTATGGFTCVPSCAGTPTGTPASVPTGTVPMVVDTTGSKLWFYIGGAWKSATLA